MIEREKPYQKGERAGQFVREFLLYRDLKRRFSENDWHKMKQRFSGVPAEEAHVAAEMLFDGIRIDYRRTLRLRSADMVQFLYEEFDVPDSLYVASLAKVSPRTSSKNLTHLLRIAPHVITEEQTQQAFISTVDRLGTYYRQNPSVLREIDMQKEQVQAAVLAARKAALSSKKELATKEAAAAVVIFQPGDNINRNERVRTWVEPEMLARIRTEMPVLWNEYHLTNGQIARLYGVTGHYIWRQRSVLEGEGVAFEKREDDRRKMPLPDKLASIPRLSQFLSPKEVARTLNMSMLVVEHHWPKAGE